MKCRNYEDLPSKYINNDSLFLFNLWLILIYIFNLLYKMSFFNKTKFS